MRPVCEQLNKVQRKCLGDTNNSWSRSTIEVEAGAVPLILRREDLAVREITKIMAKDNGQKIAECFQIWKAKTDVDRCSSGEYVVNSKMLKASQLGFAPSCI